MDNIMINKILAYDKVLFNAQDTTNSLGDEIFTHGKSGNYAIHVKKVAGSSFSLGFSIRVNLGGTDEFVETSDFTTLTFTDDDVISFDIPACESWKPYVVGDASNGADSKASIWIYYIESY